MPTYYCDTCRKLLQRHEQRHNQEETWEQGRINVVRCNKCGSDARAVYAANEQQPPSRGEMDLMVLFFFFGIPAIIVGIIALIAMTFG